MTRHLKTLMTSTLIAFGLTACNYGESSVDKTAASPVESLSKAELAAVVEEAAQKGSEVNASYNVFLAKYVTQKNGINLVAYEDVSEADERALEAYIQTLSNTDISTYSAAEQQAYWYNLYNAQTVDLILDNMPLDSIRRQRQMCIRDRGWPLVIMARVPLTRPRRPLWNLSRKPSLQLL